MKTLEHEIRDVLSGKDLEELRLLEEFIDYAAENYVITEEDEQYLVELAPIALGALALGTGARALLGGIIRNAPRIGQSILKSLKRGGQRAKVLSRRLSRAAKRKGSKGKWSSRLAALGLLGAGGGSPSKARDDSGYTKPDDYKHLSSVWTGGRPPKRITVESREDIEATPRFTETDREKIDVVPRAENDLDTANRKRFRMENIKKKIIDESLNIINSRK